MKVKQTTATDDIMNKIIRSSSGHYCQDPCCLVLINTLLVSVTMQTGFLVSLIAIAGIIAFLADVSLLRTSGTQLGLTCYVRML